MILAARALPSPHRQTPAPHQARNQGARAVASFPAVLSPDSNARGSALLPARATHASMNCTRPVGIAVSGRDERAITPTRRIQPSYALHRLTSSRRLVRLEGA